MWKKMGEKQSGMGMSLQMVGVANAMEQRPKVNLITVTYKLGPF